MFFRGKDKLNLIFFQEKNMLQVHHHLGLNELQPNPPNQNQPTSLYQRSSLTLVLFEDAATTQIHAVVDSTHGLLRACNFHQEDRLLAVSRSVPPVGWLFVEKLGGGNLGSLQAIFFCALFFFITKKGICVLYSFIHGFTSIYLEAIFIDTAAEQKSGYSLSRKKSFLIIYL